MKLQLLINNVFIIFDNCAFKIQISKKTRILDGVYTKPQIHRDPDAKPNFVINVQQQAVKSYFGTFSLKSLKKFGFINCASK